MGFISITNEGPNNLNIAGRTIPPGETKQIDESLIPRKAVPVEAEAVIDQNPLQQLLEKTVSFVKTQLPRLSDEELIELGALEEASERPRSTLLSNIQEEQLVRASAAQETPEA